jgi:hypothetical protein
LQDALAHAGAQVGEDDLRQVGGLARVGTSLEQEADDLTFSVLVPR